MAYGHLKIDTSRPAGLKLRRARDLLNEALVVLRECQGIANQCVDAGNYAEVEQVFGLSGSGTGTGTGSNGYSAWFQIAAVLDHIDVDATRNNTKTIVQQFLDQLG